jgi:radical SAM-linked protein
MEIKNRLRSENISLSLPSQRVDRFDENIANILGGNRQSGLTFAPEAGTQRMRDIVNKGLTNEELLRGVKTAWEQGWDKIKLYFMIGLPGETDADVLGIAETVAWLQRECRAKGRKPLSFNLTISNFTPKPHTPFQWHSVSTTEFKSKQNLLRQEFRRMKGVKVNFTDVRLSAMEDFIGRGDRRLASVLRRAWELGTGMDAWYDNVERAFSAWGQAIAEVNLTWKYRQVENGEWNLFTAGDAGRAGGEEEHNYELGITNYELPLPWDYIDTGIDKKWLKADLERAFAAATVPDCSFDGCSHCGVCGVDFGHNIIIEPPPIGQFAGHFVPNNTKVQRLRVWFGKLGDMALVSHLDLLRLFDRAVRRAALPISFTNGFHPSPRISITQALPLGVTSSGEIVDFELTQQLDPETFRQKLSSQLPGDIPIYQVTPIELKDPSATKILSGAEYLLTVATQAGVNLVQWQEWVEKVKSLDTIWWEQTTKSGKTQMVNLRDRLFELEVVEPYNRSSSEDNNSVILRCLGSCQQDGNKLRPEHATYMLEQVAQVEFQLLHIHRNRLLLEAVRK